MSTKMDEDDWTHTLAVFRACLPRRGRKAGDDRRFLEALHFFTVENVRWRALPQRFGLWNSVWKRFDRLSKAGYQRARTWVVLATVSKMATLSPRQRSFCENENRRPLGGVGYVNEANARGEKLIWLEPNVVNRLRVTCGSGAAPQRPVRQQFDRRRGAWLTLHMQSPDRGQAPTRRRPGHPHRRTPGPRRARPHPRGSPPTQENIWQFMRENWLSNRVFKSFNDIVDHCCDAWNKLIDQPWRIMSMGVRDWAYRS